jgi:ABC-2 type transport system ATP-binding protein
MIEFQNVTKDYRSTIALSNFTLRLEQPGIYCLLGRNGAGKTTMLKLLAGHSAATVGKVMVCEKQVGMLHMPTDLYFVESTATQFNTKLGELFHIAAQIHEEFDLPFAFELANRFGLDTKKNYKQLSFGMKVMVNTLIPLASGKNILLLDEPVRGFDPVMRKRFYTMLQEGYVKKQKTVIISTHIIDEIAKVADQLIIIDKGRLVLFSNITEIDEKAYSVSGPSDAVIAATKGLHIIGETNVGSFLTRHIFDSRLDDYEGCLVSSLSLQEFFIDMVDAERSEN